MEYIVGQVPELGQVLRLYNDAGWLAYTEKPEQLMQALERSLYQLCGLLRAVGDGCTILYIQDILVEHAHRRAGVGRRMAEMLLEAYPDVRQKVLMTDETPEMHGFYESLGFCPAEQMGLTAFYYLGKEE